MITDEMAGSASVAMERTGAGECVTITLRSCEGVHTYQPFAGVDVSRTRRGASARVTVSQAVPTYTSAWKVSR